MGKYIVLYYRDYKGKSEVLNFILKANEPCQAKIFNQIDHLKEYGLSGHNPSLRKLSGTPLWEARILGKDNIRLFCATIDSKVVIFHVFFKKRQKTPSQEISIALIRYKDLVDR
ncbi:MAG: hypothetical protein UW41_C0008G0011 [Candidatus Collierbacteria bacterium GW2011_GWC2_44_18]|uniref:Phage-related protein n=2 Tax=Microgenomates group TaxID=1794810 RepID=A0A0G1M6T7_9BACT|nr:MAG: hypothetical protein UW16_C0007G0010 [Microgenomates group bacterium GW2011_GWC1_44_10]KKT49326.1 MAG: hypothetical protein UW41_C0008G0011 [Candidatus Collierbacteria bacterium GW2011_GWC2_44_18]KKT67604.1 MAG: hypothetical protein UW60_C0003G0012 [Candidatus Woesebacteria bacterium GW2011_GWA2_44_33]